MSSSIRCVALDAVGTLIHPSPGVADVYHAAAVRFGSRRTRDDIQQRFRKAFFRSRETGTSEERERIYWRKVVREVLDDVADTDACFEQLYAHFAQPGSWRMSAGADEALAWLRSRGCRLAIASNFDQRLHGILDSFTTLAPITIRVISSEVGRRKPDPRFYEALLQRCDCRPDELLMIGDDLDCDVLAARELGIRSVLIDSSDADMSAESLSSLAQLPDWSGWE